MSYFRSLCYSAVFALFLLQGYESFSAPDISGSAGESIPLLNHGDSSYSDGRFYGRCSRIEALDSFACFLSVLSSIPVILVAVGIVESDPHLMATLTAVAALNMGIAPTSDAVLALVHWIKRNSERGSSDLENVIDDEHKISDHRTGFSVTGPALDCFNQFPPAALLFQDAQRYDFRNPLVWVGLLSWFGDIGCLVMNTVTEKKHFGIMAAAIATLSGAILVAVAPAINESNVGKSGMIAFQNIVSMVSALLGCSSGFTVSRMLLTKQIEGVTKLRWVADLNANIQSALLAILGNSPSTVVIPFFVPAVGDLGLAGTQLLLGLAQAPEDKSLLADSEAFARRLQECGIETEIGNFKRMLIVDQGLFAALSTFHKESPRILQLLTTLARSLPESIPHTDEPEPNTIFYHPDDEVYKVLVTDDQGRMPPVVLLVNQQVFTNLNIGLNVQDAR